MTHRRRRRLAASRTALTILTAFGTLAGVALVGAAPAGAASDGTTLAPGITYRQFDIDAGAGEAHAHLLTVDLANPHVSLDLLYPGAVAARATVSGLADAAGAVAGVNGDFFDISETQHPGVEATGASVGPAVAHGQALKAAVPRAQRFGPALPPGTATTDVLGMGTDRRARLDRLTLSGAVATPDGQLTLGGLNQYALPQNSVGAYTSLWGSVSRERAVCGTDTSRADGCTTDTYEVTVRDGRVVSTSDHPGSGAVPADTTVLLGREAGADELRKLSPGEQVTVRHELVPATGGVPFVFAIGGYPVLRDGQALPGLDDSVSAVRTAAGFSSSGRTLFLLALDGASAYRTGMTIAEEADTLRTLGASDAFNFDGGGSSELVARPPAASRVTVRNHPSGGAERPVANGIGVFSTS
ncbi:phosphodiester glycosidase family protein [Streptomyces sp. L2]|uniref:phosphodiester glycosidase family protein n=1 Tax=Streptomyces sp. L2 TaxID=2162665 RepID=UPI0010112E48|nr:phosphodiester glycosidase family protein [Streptomyces sp. L2]